MKKFILALVVAMLCSCEDELIASADDMRQIEVVVEEPLIDVSDSSDTKSDSATPELYPITFNVNVQDYIEL